MQDKRTRKVWKLIFAKQFSEAAFLFPFPPSFPTGKWFLWQFESQTESGCGCGFFCVSFGAEKLHAPLHFVTIIAGVWRLTTPTAPPFRNSPMENFGAGIHTPHNHEKLRKNFSHESQLFVFLPWFPFVRHLSFLYNLTPVGNWIVHHLVPRIFAPPPGFLPNLINTNWGSSNCGWPKYHVPQWNSFQASNAIYDGN